MELLNTMMEQGVVSTLANELHNLFLLIFGNEVMGVEQQVVDACDGAIEIPQAGTKHSLNIAVSAGMVLWEMYKQHLEAQASGQNL